MTSTFCTFAPLAIDGLTHCASIDVGFEAQPAATNAAMTATKLATMRAIMGGAPGAAPGLLVDCSVQFGCWFPSKNSA